MVLPNAQVVRTLMGVRKTRGTSAKGREGGKQVRRTTGRWKRWQRKWTARWWMRRRR